MISIKQQNRGTPQDGAVSNGRLLKQPVSQKQVDFLALLGGAEDALFSKNPGGAVGSLSADDQGGGKEGLVTDQQTANFAVYAGGMPAKVLFSGPGDWSAPSGGVGSTVKGSPDYSPTGLVESNVSAAERSAVSSQPAAGLLERGLAGGKSQEGLSVTSLHGDAEFADVARGPSVGVWQSRVHTDNVARLSDGRMDVTRNAVVASSNTDEAAFGGAVPSLTPISTNLLDSGLTGVAVLHPQVRVLRGFDDVAMPALLESSRETEIQLALVELSKSAVAGEGQVSSGVSSSESLSALTLNPSGLALDQRQNAAHIGSTVSWLVSQKGGVVSLDLTPPDIGQLRMELRLDSGGEQAVLIVQASSEAARAAIEQSLDKLSQAFDASGLSLSVSVQSGGGGWTGHAGTQEFGRPFLESQDTEVGKRTAGALPDILKSKKLSSELSLYV